MKTLKLILRSYKFYHTREPFWPQTRLFFAEAFKYTFYWGNTEMLQGMLILLISPLLVLQRAFFFLTRPLYSVFRYKKLSGFMDMVEKRDSQRNKFTQSYDSH